MLSLLVVVDDDWLVDWLDVVVELFVLADFPGLALEFFELLLFAITIPPITKTTNTANAITAFFTYPSCSIHYNIN